MELRIAIISDLHCRHSKYKTESETVNNTYLFSDRMRSPIKQHPAQALISKIKELNIKADMVLCPGDITDKTDPQGLITGWSFLEEIKDALGAECLIASLGNHDVDSRQIHNTYDSFNMPTRLKSNFPFINEIAKYKYYSKKYCFIEVDDTLIFNYNSVHSHTNKVDCLTSLISDDILENIEEELKTYSTKNFKFKIALTHHHPTKHANIGIEYKDSDVIEKGDKLLELLDKYDFQIFIHGHKHIPRLMYYNSLPVLSSGSFSSLMNIKDTGDKNMIHFITLYSEQKTGEIKTFEFTNGLGWSGDFNSSKFPSDTGFGNRSSIQDIISKIKTYFDSENKDFIKFNKVINDLPELKYLIPVDFEKLRTQIKKSSLIFYPDNQSIPDQLTKYNL